VIVTVTLNPSLDRTIQVDRLVRGAVHRAGDVRVDAGGKGVNMARALAANGHKVRAVLPQGGGDGDELVALLSRAGIDHRAVPIADAVRTNVSIAEPDGTVTKLNTPGPSLTAREIDALIDAALEAAAGATWVVCSGSLPPGAPDTLYARLTRALHDAGCAVAVDTSDAAFARVLAAGPDVVKPNQDELTEAVGRPVTTLGEAVTAAEELRSRGARTVLASLGAAGALLVSPEAVLHGTAATARVRSAVGAGDAALAGFLSAGGGGREALAEALAWGAAAVRLPGSRMPEPDDLRRREVRIHAAIDPRQPLTTGAAP
jgi:1-phosphofructokinase